MSNMAPPAEYAVRASAQRVDAWSRIRLPYEPKGWLRDYRDELRTALRAMPPGPSGVLLAEYATPDDQFSDVENVLLYNVGSGAYSHLSVRGLICRRVSSVDGAHRVNYAMTEQLEWPEFAGSELATVTLKEPVREDTPSVWWSAFRQGMQVHSGSPHPSELAVDIEVGTAWKRSGLFANPKALLDGLVAALHVHDGSSREHITAVFGDSGTDQRLWRMLNDPSQAILGQRRLVRPHGAWIAWNPADELCTSFRLTRGRHDAAVTATIHAIDTEMIPSLAKTDGER